MPAQYNDIFDDLPLRLDSSVNPYVKDMKEIIENRTIPVMFGSMLKGVKGSWRREFSEQMNEDTSDRELVIEIGCHKGRTILEAAHKYPDKLFVGMDITFKRVVTTAKRAKAQGLKNVIIVFGSARALDLIFAPEELNGVIAFHPDPWQRKKSQLKNRLFSDTFCREIANCLSDGGFFWFKTDDKSYFDDVASFAPHHKFGAAGNKEGILAERFLTVFEERFLQQDMPVYSDIWVKQRNH